MLMSVMSEIKEAGAAGRAESQGTLKDYLAIARLDHVTKQVFIIPGIVLAFALHRVPINHAAIPILIGFCSAVAIASANYVINEWLDREFDAFHPKKSARTAVNKKLSPTIIYAEYAVLLLVGLLLAANLGHAFFFTSLLFALSGVVYNVKPMRTKDRAYLDVISESVNNPIRLTLGWTMVDPSALPPSSLMLACWTGGAFLMGAKRLSEYRDISASAGVAALQRYRKSFNSYTSENLTVSTFLYAILSAFFIAVFLIKYRIEYILAFPFLSVLFALYFWLSLLSNSVAQRPERLFRSRRLVACLALVVLTLAITTFVDMPALQYLSEPSFIPGRK